MLQFRFSLPALTMGLMAVGLTAPAFSETLKKPALDQLAAAWQGGKPASSFNASWPRPRRPTPS